MKHKPKYFKRIKAKEVDQLLNKVIKNIGLDEETFSCNALSRSWGSIEVRQFYTQTYCPGDNSRGGVLLSMIQSAYPSDKDRVNQRIVMLSLFKAAWRDLI